MIVGLSVNPHRDEGFEVLKKTVRILDSHGIRCLTAQAEVPSQSGLDAVLKVGSWGDCDLVISIGGDGSFLTAVQSVYEHDVPLIGINRGGLGFMNEIQVPDLETDLNQLIRGDYKEVTRMMLEVRCLDSTGRERMSVYGLNDAVLSRGGHTRIVPVRLYLDDEYIETIPADGMIVASPVGSTGYSLAAGGVIVDPELQVLQITPICPHTLHNRSYILPPDCKVSLSIDDGYPFKPLLSVDGRSDVYMDPGDRAEVRQAAKPMRLLQLHHESFFKKLPAKMNARGGYRA